MQVTNNRHEIKYVFRKRRKKEIQKSSNVSQLTIDFFEYFITWFRLAVVG